MSDSLITKKAIAQCLKNLAAEKSFLKISKTIDTEGFDSLPQNLTVRCRLYKRRKPSQFEIPK